MFKNQLKIKRISQFLWEIEKASDEEMLVPARFYASDKLIDLIKQDRSLDQLVNVATLPGIQKWALAMPDIHEGYGFPIGAVAAFDIKEGIISPGGVGYDINCGVRLLKSELKFNEVARFSEKLVHELSRNVPAGLGSRFREKLSDKELDKILSEGAKRIVETGFGEKSDLKHCEEEGKMNNADHSLVSQRAKSRGKSELGTLGSGNHFLEVQRVDYVFDSSVAKALGIFEGQVTLMIHCGSRGLGHQVASDYIREFMKLAQEKEIKLVDKELVWAKIESAEGKRYLSAMAAACNFAWANRQKITYLVRKGWSSVFGENGGSLKLVYDVAHNIAKLEEHIINGNKKLLCVHRKGATRAFGPDRRELHKDYRRLGQPVIIPGTMGTASYLMIGTTKAMEDTFGSVCHGSGRVMSRRQAKRLINMDKLKKFLSERGIIAKTITRVGLLEEAPQAYKDIEEIISVVSGAGISLKVARLKPIAVIKG